MPNRKSKPVSIDSIFEGCKNLVAAQTAIQEWMKDPPEDKLEYIDATLLALLHGMQRAQVKVHDLQHEQTKLCKNCDQILNLLLIARSK